MIGKIIAGIVIGTTALLAALAIACGGDDEQPAPASTNPAARTYRSPSELAAIVCAEAPGVGRYISVAPFSDVTPGSLDGERVADTLWDAANALDRHKTEPASAYRFHNRLIDLLDASRGYLRYGEEPAFQELRAVLSAWEALEPRHQAAMACLAPSPLDPRTEDCLAKNGKWIRDDCVPISAWCDELDTSELRRDPDNVDGCFRMSLTIQQYDSRTGPCLFLARDDAFNLYALGTRDNAEASRGHRSCVIASAGFSEGDSVTVWARAQHAWTFQTPIGGTNTLPYLQLLAIRPW